MASAERISPVQSVPLVMFRRTWSRTATASIVAWRGLSRLSGSDVNKAPTSRLQRRMFARSLLASSTATCVPSAAESGEEGEA